MSYANLDKYFRVKHMKPCVWFPGQETLDGLVKQVVMEDLILKSLPRGL